MPKKIQHNPILILPQKDVPFASSNHGEAGSGAQTAEGFMAGGFSRGAAFLAEPFKLSHAEWAWLAINHPTLFQNYMRFPYDPTVLCELAKVALGNGIRDLSQDGSFVDSAVSDHYIDLTPMSSRSLGVFFGRAGGVQPSLVRVVFDQGSGEYRVEWRNTGFVSKRDVDGIFSSGFKHGSPVARLTNHVALGKVITDVGVSDNVMKGAMVMLIPNEALFEPPDIIAMSENRLGVPQYYRIEGPEAPKGSSVELVISPVEGRPVGERFRVGDLIDLLFQDAVSAWEKGRTPALALDLDGTLFDARGYTVLLFREWLAQYDGP
ncbi:MAG TPA: hypothetical protein PLZ86_10380, partial [bacterium]|nr:hypothetical protein [bacterium]